VRIAHIEGPAQVVRNESALPAIAGHGVYKLENSDLLIKVADTANNKDRIKIELVWETYEGQSSRVFVTLLVATANIEVDAVDFGAHAQGIMPGSTGEIYLTLKNTGNEPITNGHINLLPGACIDSITGELDIAQILPGESLRLEQAFVVSVSPQCQNGDFASIQAIIAYDSVAQRNYLGSLYEIPVGIVSEDVVTHENINLTIPDAGDPVEFLIEWTKTGTITDIGVALNITHSYVGDLEVKLVHPSGQEIILHDRTDGTDEDINTVYGRNGVNTPELKKLNGKRAEGQWKLIVQDKAGIDEGVLNSISLNIAGYLN
jgi:subtilisin-like proprotein convertase family protein